MQRIIVILTFIPWFMFYSNSIKNSLKYLKDIDFNSEWLKKHLFQVFHFNDLILYGIFVYFTSNYYKSNQIWLVSILLFTVINIYLYINSFYDKNRSKNKINYNDLSQLLIILFLSIIPVVYYILTKEYIITYYILFGFNFFNFIIVLLARYINKKLIKLIKTHNDE